MKLGIEKKSVGSMVRVEGGTELEDEQCRTEWINCAVGRKE